MSCCLNRYANENKSVPSRNNNSQRVLQAGLTQSTRYKNTYDCDQQQHAQARPSCKYHLKSRNHELKNGSN